MAIIHHGTKVVSVKLTMGRGTLPLEVFAKRALADEYISPSMVVYEDGQESWTSLRYCRNADRSIHSIDLVSCSGDARPFVTLKA